MNDPTRIQTLLDHIDPADLDYQEWVNVGMALKHEGLGASEWDAWSQRDHARYKPGECERKWAGFNGSSTPVTAGTLVEFAKRAGWREDNAPHKPDRAFDWDDVIGGKAARDLQVIDPAWVADATVEAPTNWNPVNDLVTYLQTLFSADEYVGYVTEAWRQDDRWLPKKGSYSRTCGELVAELTRYRDFGAALGDYNPDVGAWIRINPFDGKGISDANVTAYRFALVESDTLSIERQAALYAELELPVAALVHSGKKSLHAIVRIGATSKEEYRERVNYLHKVCAKNGLTIDTQNKNPSRLSRMPGVMRAGKPQYLLGVNQGKESFEAWREWVEEQNDNLPDIEPLDVVWNALPPLADPLIDGVLRQGHKMLLAGPSKAGKSYLLLQLAMAVAEGREWLGWPCARGRVLYVNLELDRASCLHRLRLLYEAKGWTPQHLGNIDIWNLRGRAVPMDHLAPKLIRRAQKRGYMAVIIDPIYKVLTGDENAADKMAHFCNQFDRLCTELGAATIYCHHHSKGAQGQKSSRDRSSGSGVFARDPDTLLDLIELGIERPMREVLENRTVCAAIEALLDQYADEWRDDIGQDDAIVAAKFAEAAQKLLPGHAVALEAAIADARRRASIMTGWRLEGTLREFAPFPPRDLIFAYPVHTDDRDGVLSDAKAAGEEAPWAAEQRERKRERKEKAQSAADKVRTAFNTFETWDDSQGVSVAEIAEQTELPEAKVIDIARKTPGLMVIDQTVHRRESFLHYQITKHQGEEAISLSTLAEQVGVTTKTIRNWLNRSTTWRVQDGKIFPQQRL